MLLTCRRRCWTSLYTDGLLSSAYRRPYSTKQQRPYALNIGISYAGKPPYSKQKASKAHFPKESPIVKWRDQTLAGAVGQYKNAGEDFFFTQSMRANSGVAFGVADGVGGWSESGVDPSLFAQALMYHCHRYSKHGWPGEPEVDPTLDYAHRQQVEGWETLPRACIGMAHDAVTLDKLVQAGSSTASVLNFNYSSGLLRAANLGDSGFAIIRSTSVIHQQTPQTHFFNCPRQLAKIPNAGRNKRAKEGFGDTAADADEFEATLRHGDMIVVYTDGFSDNVFPKEMLSICSLTARRSGPEEKLPERIASNLVAYAQKCMHREDKISPFQLEAATIGKDYPGGKVDDVTVIVGIVSETP